MNLKLNSKGFTLLEVIVSTAILVIVVSSAYSFLNFSYRRFNDTQAEYTIGQEARLSLIKMENYIHGANKAVIGAITHNGVEIPTTSGGMQLDIYFDINDDGVMDLVQYKLMGDSLVMGTAALGSDPTIWTTVVERVKNNILSTPVELFTIDGYQVNVSLLVYDKMKRFYEDPAKVEVSYTVRSKGVMN